MSVVQLVERIKENDEDFEWYPTTQEIITALQEHTKETILNHCHSVLDIGCGNGSFLQRFCSGEKFSRLRMYGMEKSNILAEQLPDEVVLVGSDFDENTLIDKKVDLIFCNPPYSQYKHWTERIIREGNAKFISLVIPTRWRDSDSIAEALSKRRFTAEVVGTYDFSNAERKARARVDLVFISCKETYRDRVHIGNPVDPFDLWFDETFSINAEKSPYHSFNDGVKERVHNEIMLHGDTAETLVRCYNSDMEKLHVNYWKLEDLDPELFDELKINLGGLKKALRTRLEGLKSVYWRELFQRYDKITQRLTTTERQRVVNRLNDNTAVDFTMSNIVQLTLWVIRNSNKLFDEQISEYFFTLCNSESILRYKSNKRWNDDDWRYIKDKFGNWSGRREAMNLLREKGTFMLDYRMVVDGCSNFDTWCRTTMTESCRNFLEDTAVIGRNLGYDIDLHLPPVGKEIRIDDWKNFNITCRDGKIFANVKLYKNGNRHVKFRKDFMQRLNVEMARINGWVQDKREAMEEMDITMDVMDEIWGSTIKIDCNSGRRLLGLPA